jgi:IS30 family transposase
MSLVEREEISRGLVAGLSKRAMRSLINSYGRPRLSRGGAGQRRSPPLPAHRSEAHALRLARRPKPAKLAVNAALREIVEAKLELRWSPQQISGWLKRTYLDEAEMRVSHERIYLALFVQSRGALRKELTHYLRTGRAHRRPAGLTVNNGQLRRVVHISQRPADAEDRAVPGHWKAI